MPQKNKDILISIITIVYNGEKFLQQTIDSVANQTYKNIEYIIVDGGSTDKTLDIIKKNKKTISKWISEKDNGVSDAFNKGIEMSSGEIIGIINADDWYQKDALKLVADAAKKIKNKKEVVFFSNMNYVNKDKKIETYNTNIQKLKNEMTLNHPAVFVTKETYQKHGKFLLNYKYAMDYEILLRFYIKKVHFEKVDEVLSNMRADGLSDMNWIFSLKESRNAKILNGKNILTSYFYFFYQVFRKIVSLTLKKIGLQKIVFFYRRYFSVMKKKKL